MKIKTNGVTRIVILLKTVVIKIPNFRYRWDHFLMGLTSNIHEGKTWRYNSGIFELGKSKYLCPVVWTSWGGWILIMKRAKDLPYGIFSDKLIATHKEYFPGDDGWGNYGMYQGRIVKIDYGQLEAWPSDIRDEEKKRVNENLKNINQWRK